MDTCTRHWILDPLESKWLSYWDIVTTVALAYTAFVTPVEVSFLPSVPFEDRMFDVLFWLNRSVDLVFIADMVLQFRVAVKLSDAGGTRWLRDPVRVAKHYVQGKWFYLDAFSISTSIFDLLPLDDAQSLTLLRAVRVLRLAKLVRLLRGSRIFKKWELRISINYAYLSVVSLATMIVIGCHWIACFWGLQASFYPLQSWYYGVEYCIEWGHPNMTIAMEMPCPAEYPMCEIGNCNGETCEGGYACVSWANMYSYSLYFAVMTITSVGYGDILASPLNIAEQLICSFIMLSSGMLWGYLIGTFCGLAAALSPSVQAFREDLSSLNSMMTIYSLPAEMRYRLREYIHETQHLRNTEARNALLTKLSPSMQGEVQLLVNQKWIDRVWYLARAETELLIELSFNLTALVFPPREFCPSGFMYIVQRGSAFHLGRLRGELSVWGDDVILDEPELQINIPAIAVTYLWVYVINGDKLNALLQQFPKTARRLAPIKRRLKYRRLLIRAAERVCHDEGRAFRGRLRPIFAADVRQELEEQAQRRMRETMHESCNLGSYRKRGLLLAHMGSGRCKGAAGTVESPASTAAGEGKRGGMRRASSLVRRKSGATPALDPLETDAMIRHMRLAAQNVGMSLRTKQMGLATCGNGAEPLGGSSGSRHRRSARHSHANLAAQPAAWLEQRVASIEESLVGFGGQLQRIEALLVANGSGAASAVGSHERAVTPPPDAPSSGRCESLEPRLSAYAPASGHCDSFEPRLSAYAPASGHCDSFEPRLSAYAPAVSVPPSGSVLASAGVAAPAALAGGADPTAAAKQRTGGTKASDSALIA